MRLVLVLTHACDLACEYCYAGEKSARAMPVETGRRAIDRALAAVRPGGRLELALFGGEPLLAWPVGRELVAHARRAAAARGAALEVDLTTNGTRLEGRTLDELLALGARVAVSMDGLPEVHDAARPRRGGRPSSDAALAAIDRLVARGVRPRVISVVRPASVDRLAAGARLLADRCGAGGLTLVHSLDWSAPWRAADGRALRGALRDLRRLYVERFPAVEVAWLETKAALLANPGLARPACGAGGEVAVAPSGRLYPCERLVGEDTGRHAVGHLDDDPGPLRPRRAAAAGDPGCDGCSAQGACSNDCACANLARTGDAARPDGLVCLLEQGLLDEAAAALEELARGRRRLPLAVVRG